MKTLTILLVSSAIALALVPAAVARGQSATTVTTQNGLTLPILAELNSVRTAHGLAPVRTTLPLRRAADLHARSMGSLGYFSHASADGTTFSRRVATFYPQGSFRSWAVGENLLWSTDDLTARQAVRMWMASPGHRRNILSPRWRQIGISAVRVTAAPGAFGGRDVTILVTDFGARS